MRRGFWGVGAAYIYIYICYIYIYKCNVFVFVYSSFSISSPSACAFDSPASEKYPVNALAVSVFVSTPL